MNPMAALTLSAVPGDQGQGMVSVHMPHGQPTALYSAVQPTASTTPYQASQEGMYKVFQQNGLIEMS